jgi:hypothetical protein
VVGILVPMDTNDRSHIAAPPANGRQRCERCGHVRRTSPPYLPVGSVEPQGLAACDETSEWVDEALHRLGHQGHCAECDQDLPAVCSGQDTGTLVIARLAKKQDTPGLAWSCGKWGTPRMTPKAQECTPGLLQRYRAGLRE